MNDRNEESASDEVIALTEGYCNGTLDDDGLARLEQLLLQDTAARTHFRRYLELDTALREHGETAAVHWSPVLKGLPSLRGLPSESGLSTASEDVGSLQAYVKPGRSTSGLQSIGRRMSSMVQIAGLAGILVAGVASILTVIVRQPEASPTAIAILEQVTGDVRVLGSNGRFRAIAASSPIGQGDMVRTRGSESSTVVAFPDGTRLTLVGNTSITCGDHRSKSIVVHQGTLAARVKPQPAGKPLLLTTPSAQVQVLGTRFQIEALQNRTDLSVTEGRVRLVRLRDQESVEVPDGKCASVTESNKLLVKDIPDLPSTWDADFEAGLPEGWERGEWVASGLPPGSRGGVKATAEEVGGGRNNYSIVSNDAWLQGLFAAQNRSHMHFTFKTEKQSWINVFIVTRTTGPQDARFSGNYLLGNFPKAGSGQWETVSIPLNRFKRIHSGTAALTDVVPFKLLFVSDEPDRGLVLDRVWITPDGPGEIVSRIVEAGGLRETTHN